MKNTCFTLKLSWNFSIVLNSTSEYFDSIFLCKQLNIKSPSNMSDFGNQKIAIFFQSIVHRGCIDVWYLILISKSSKNWLNTTYVKILQSSARCFRIQKHNWTVNNLTDSKLKIKKNGLIVGKIQQTKVRTLDYI